MPLPLLWDASATGWHPSSPSTLLDRLEPTGKHRCQVGKESRKQQQRNASAPTLMSGARGSSRWMFSALPGQSMLAATGTSFSQLKPCLHKETGLRGLDVVASARHRIQQDPIGQISSGGTAGLGTAGLESCERSVMPNPPSCHLPCLMRSYGVAQGMLGCVGLLPLFA